jgi:hypothetical protein
VRVQHPGQRRRPRARGHSGTKAVTGKEIRDFPIHLLRVRAWRRQVLGYARTGLPAAPGHSDLGLGPWAETRPRGGLTPVPQSPGLQNSQPEDCGNHPRRPPGISDTRTAPTVFRGPRCWFWGWGQRPPEVAQGTISRERRRPRRLI